MTGRNKEINAGDGSTNIQGEKVHVQQYVSQGLNYSEVKEIAMDVFKSNFYDLGEKVERVISERAEEVINKYLKRLEEESPDSISNTEDPDLRFAIYEVQKSYARLGDEEMSDILVDVLLQRTTNQDEPFKKLVLNEALTIVPKLTTKQIDTLSLIYLIKYLNYISNFKIPFEHYLDTINPFIQRMNFLPINEMLYQHLQYSGCISISVATADFDSIMIHKFPHLFQEQRDVTSTLNQHPGLNSLKTYGMGLNYLSVIYQVWVLQSL
ncbi:LPO_1073/Vpar_1526 family protein [Priestia megaterium]